MQALQQVTATGTESQLEKGFPMFGETPSEYRFVYNQDEIKRATKFVYPWILFMLMYGAAMVFYPKFEYYKLLALVPFVLTAGMVFALYRFYFSRLSITFDQNGMTSAGFWLLSNQMPSRSAWSEFSKICKNELSGKFFLNTLSGMHQIIFMHRSGKKYVLVTGSSKGPAYVGVGHSLSIEEVLEKFAGSIQNLSDSEKTGVLALKTFVDLGGEVGYVAYAAIGVTVLAVVLMLLPDPPRLLDNAFTVSLYWIAGLGAGALACWYMRRIKQKVMMVIPALLLGGVTAMLLVPVMGRLPMLLGTQERLVFKVAEENAEEQRWQAAAHPELTFSIALAPERNMLHKGVGAEHTLTIYRGPGPLNAMRASEYRALHHREPPSERASESPARKGQGIDSKGNPSW
ncbi:MAG: hypothetical protein LBI48_08810 [Burkholderiaceae bacterium]|jgi:hypothetical protein|nr:hypothetical protein [Burkholderiaceae bacterium]